MLGHARSANPSPLRIPTCHPTGEEGAEEGGAEEEAAEEEAAEEQQEQEEEAGEEAAGPSKPAAAVKAAKGVDSHTTTNTDASGGGGKEAAVSDHQARAQKGGGGAAGFGRVVKEHQGTRCGYRRGRAQRGWSCFRERSPATPPPAHPNAQMPSSVQPPAAVAAPAVNSEAAKRGEAVRACAGGPAGASASDSLPRAPARCTHLQSHPLSQPGPAGSARHARTDECMNDPHPAPPSRTRLPCAADAVVGAIAKDFSDFDAGLIEALLEQEDGDEGERPRARTRWN